MKTWKEFNLCDVDPEYDYDFKFNDGHIEKWYGQEIIKASESQGAIFIFNITYMKKLNKPSTEEVKKRREEFNNFKESLKNAVKYLIKRQDEIIEKACLSNKYIEGLSVNDLKERFLTAKKNFPDYEIELNFLEAIMLKDIN